MPHIYLENHSKLNDPLLHYHPYMVHREKINTLANGYIRYFITSDACDCLKISMVIEIRRELICALQDRLFDGRQKIYGTCKLPVSEGGSPVHCVINPPFCSFLRQNH